MDFYGSDFPNLFTILIRNNDKIQELNLKNNHYSIPDDFFAALASNNSLKKLNILGNYIQNLEASVHLMIHSKVKINFIDRREFTEIIWKMILEDPSKKINFLEYY